MALGRFRSTDEGGPFSISKSEFIPFIVEARRLALMTVCRLRAREIVPRVPNPPRKASMPSRGMSTM